MKKISFKKIFESSFFIAKYPIGTGIAIEILLFIVYFFAMFSIVAFCSFIAKLIPSIAIFINGFGDIVWYLLLLHYSIGLITFFLIKMKIVKQI
jgi:hypothetical protein